MDLSKLRTGERSAAVSALLLFIFMFFSWYAYDVEAATGVKVPDAVLGAAGVDTTRTAWQSFDVLDLYLLLTLLAALVLAFLTATDRSVALPVGASVITTVLGGIAVVWVVIRILDQPGPNEFVTVKIGAWLGLLACIGIAVGGYLAMRDEGTTFDQAFASARDSIPTRPVPPAEGGAPAAPAETGTSVPPPSAPSPPAPTVEPGEEPPPPNT
jgi:hypothetical protein